MSAFGKLRTILLNAVSSFYLWAFPSVNEAQRIHIINYFIEQNIKRMHIPLARSLISHYIHAIYEIFKDVQLHFIWFSCI